MNKNWKKEIENLMKLSGDDFVLYIPEREWTNFSSNIFGVPDPASG